MVLGSAATSASETALTALGDLRARQLVETGGRRARCMRVWVEHPERVLSAVLVTNTLLNIGGGVLAGEIAAGVGGRARRVGGHRARRRHRHRHGRRSSSPARWSRRPSPSATRSRFALALIPFVSAVSLVLWPVSMGLVRATHGLMRLFGGGKVAPGPAVTSEEIEYIIEMGTREGVLDEVKEELLNSVLEFADRVVKEIMVPRTRMVALDRDASRDEIVRVVTENPYSRMPVYEGSADNIVGILMVRDIVLEVARGPGPIPWERVLKPAFFVPEQMKVSRLLKEMQRRKTHLAVVVDEFGGTSGVVTLEDILEEIVGEIQDEGDAESAQVKTVAAGVWMADAAVPLRELEEFLDRETGVEPGREGRAALPGRGGLRDPGRVRHGLGGPGPVGRVARRPGRLPLHRARGRRAAGHPGRDCPPGAGAGRGRGGLTVAAALPDLRSLSRGRGGRARVPAGGEALPRAPDLPLAAPEGRGHPGGDERPPGGAARPPRGRGARSRVLERGEERRSTDGTIKWTWRTQDGKLIESVYMPEPGRKTLCVSTQAGCAVGCTFCMTGTMGLARNLSSGEIVDQVSRANRRLLELGEGAAPRPLTNLVFMGMGEPLHNYDAVKAALDVLLSEDGPNFSNRHVTVSTSGIVPEMRRFGEETDVKLAVSLNATTDEVRTALMPLNRRWPLAELLAACRDFPMKKGRRITFEYVLLGRGERRRRGRRPALPPGEGDPRQGEPHPLQREPRAGLPGAGAGPGRGLPGSAHRRQRDRGGPAEPGAGHRGGLRPAGGRGRARGPAAPGPDEHDDVDRPWFRGVEHRSMALLAVGSVALDSLQTPFGVREDVLGGSATYFSTAASFFAPVRVVAVVGEDFPQAHLDFLRGRGVDVSGIERRPGRTFRWKGRYEFDLNQAHTLDTQLNVFADFRPELPEAFRDSSHVFLGNIDPELQLSVLDQVRAPRIVAADTMNFWIASKRTALLEVLRRVDLLFVNDAEARQLAGRAQHRQGGPGHPGLRPPRGGGEAGGVRRALLLRGRGLRELGLSAGRALRPDRRRRQLRRRVHGVPGPVRGARRPGHAPGHRGREHAGELRGGAVQPRPAPGAGTARDPRPLRRVPAPGPFRRPRRRRPPGGIRTLTMRIAILSDVHANLEALTEVERAIAKRGVDLVVSLGDVVGYGASPNECCDILRRLAGVALLGNHDAAVTGRMDYAFYYDAARHALDWTAGVLRPEHRVWLAGLPYSDRVGDVGFSHGSPLQPEAYDYILASEQAAELIPIVDAAAAGDLHRPLAPHQGLRAAGRERGGRGVRAGSSGSGPGTSTS